VAQSKLSQAPVLAQPPRAIGLNSALHDFKKTVLYLTEIIVENIARPCAYLRKHLPRLRALLQALNGKVALTLRDGFTGWRYRDYPHHSHITVENATATESQVVSLS
jgi:hypothetical protein